MMKIEFIKAPYIYTDDGKRIEISKLKGIPRVGSELSEDMRVLNNTSNSDCVSGVCPIK